MRIAAAILMTVLALSLAACGGGSKSTADTTPSTPSTPSTTSTTIPTTTTVVTSTVSKTVSAGPSACTAADFAVAFLGQQGATGHGVLGFALRNVTDHSCHTYGYPGILFLSKTGSPLPTAPSHTTRDFFGTAPETPLTVAPGATVSFRLGVTHGVVPGEPCTTAFGLQVIPPDDTHTLVAKISDGAYECRTATVTPLRPGTSAYPPS